MSLQATLKMFCHVTLGLEGVSKVRSNSSVFKSCTSVLRSKTTTSLHVRIMSITTHMCTALCMLLTNMTSLQSSLGQNDWLALHMFRGGSCLLSAAPLSVQAHSQHRCWQADVLYDTACGCVDQEQLARSQRRLLTRPNIRHQAGAKKHLCYSAAKQHMAELTILPCS